MVDIRPANAIISVSDKAGLKELSSGLTRHGIKILSTGGTSIALRNLDFPVTEISAYTESPELMNGRLKTLHPKIHGGLLARRDQDNAEMLENEIEGIDLLFVNFSLVFVGAIKFECAEGTMFRTDIAAKAHAQ